MAIRFTLNNLPSAAFVMDSKGLFVDFNTSFCEILGCTTGELAENTLYRFMDLGEVEKLKDVLKAPDFSKTTKLDVVIRSAKGYSYTLELHVSKLDDKPEVLFLVLVNNITHLRRVTDELREQRRLHKTLVQNMPGIVYRCKWDREYTMEYISSPCFEVTGYRPEDLINNKKVSFNSLIQEEYRELIWTKWKEALANKSTFSFEYPIVTANGHQRWLWEQGVGVHDANNNLIAIEGILIDITQRKQADVALRKSEALFRTLVENAFDGIYLLRNRKFEYVNMRLEEIVGYSLSEITNEGFQIKSLFTTRSLEHVDKHLGLVEQSISIPNHFELQIVTKDGEVKDVEVSTAVLDSEQDVVLLGIVRDVTERKRSQKLIKENEAKLKIQNEEYQALNEELRETNERIISINADLLEAKQRAEEHDKLKSAFLANMSHEVRTPLNGILGFSQLLLNNEHTVEERAEYIDIIQKSGHQLLAIINDLIDISKIEANQITIEPNKTDINEFINEQYLLHSVKANECNITLESYIDLPDEKFVVEVDDARLRQIFSHIIGNAFKFTRLGSIKFGYRLTPDNDMIEFFVEDTGVGIPYAMQEKIFDRFRQVEVDLSRQAGGTGLGLAISKALVSKMGGEIWVVSKVNQGSTFFFTIPNKRVTQEHISSTSVFIDDVAKTTSNIIIADDNEVNFMYLKQLLKVMDANIMWAHNGQEVVDLVENNNNIDLILMDIKMPVMDGYEATRIVKQMRPEIPIIAQTAHAISGDKEEALTAGCDEYISKPINRTKFIEKVNTLLLRKQ